MSYKAFMRVFWCVLILIIVAAGCGVKGCISNHPSSPAVTQQQQVPYQQPYQAPPTAAPAAPRQLTTADIRMKIEQWLAEHPSRNGQLKQLNILPAEPFRATAIRFAESDAIRWTSNPNDWTQIRLDLDRDGTDDEKWLLKDGHTYKREVLDRSGRTVSSEHFN